MKIYVAVAREYYEWEQVIAAGFDQHKVEKAAQRWMADEKLVPRDDRGYNSVTRRGSPDDFIIDCVEATE